MSEVVNLVLPAVGGLCLLAALVYVVKGIVGRHRIGQQAYGFGRQEVRQSIQRDFVYGFVLLVLGLVLMSAFGVSMGLADDELAAATATIQATPAVATTGRPTVTVTVAMTPSPSGTATTAVEPDTPTPVASVTPPGTPTTVKPTATVTGTLPLTATVNSEVGLYLREAPGGTQEIELLPHEAVLILLPGLELAADGTEWQQVRTAAGNEGWVAVAFILYYDGTPVGEPTGQPTPTNAP
jgi:hypothetical protein